MTRSSWRGTIYTNSHPIPSPHMPRRYRDHRDEDDYDRPPRKSNGLLIGLLVGGGAVLLLGLAGCIGFVFYVGKKADEMEKKEGARVKALPTREEFKAKVMGKSKDEVLALLGKPESTSSTGGEHWIYNGLTRDAISGKEDTRAWIWLDQTGHVVAVDF